MIIEIFTKLGKEFLEVWLSGKEKEGDFRAWHKNGRLAHKSFWKDRKPDGVVLWWWPDGKLKTRSIFKNGENTSIKYWNEKGELVSSS